MRRFTILFFLGLFFFPSCTDDTLLTDASQSDIVAGLKQALTVSTDTCVSRTSRLNGYFANAAIKILLPPEAEKVESTLRSIGLGSLVDNAILSVNRAAEDAASSATPIFVNAITSITISDGRSILFGDSVAATEYLKTKTHTSLKSTYMPKIKASLDKVNATAYWNDVFSAYNKLPFVTPVNPDLTDYTTTRALDGLFYMVGKQEIKIRKDPVDRVTTLLQQVFGQLDHK